MLIAAIEVLCREAAQQIGATRMTNDNNPEPNARYWRYQPIRVNYPEYPNDPELVIIEVYLDRADDSLRAWSADPVGKRPAAKLSRN